MMYSHNFTAAIKVNNNILREFGDTVYLPFGSEYKIFLKNLNTTRAKVTVEIDGQNVTDGGLVIDSFQTVDLERFIRNGNLSEGNRFKFIERTSKIEDHRGIKLEDGLITIRYVFEVPMLIAQTSTPLVYKGSGGGKYKSFNSVNINCGISDVGPISVTASSVPINETGITVEGSKSDQKFSSTHWRGSIGGSHSMVIRLLGETEENKKVREPVTVKTKLECKTCGTLNPSKSKFCSECGTSLEIVGG
jgi:hypothetical protein